MNKEEYEYIIEQQKEIIKQQKELIDKLLIKVNDDNRIVIPIEKDRQVPYYPTPPIITCSDMPYCTEAPMDENKIYTSYTTTSASNSDKPVVVDLEPKIPDEVVIYNTKEK